MGAQQTHSWQGKMLGRYRLLKRLGRGGMGEAWLAEDTQLQRQVVAKIMPIVPANAQTYLQNFTREAQNAASLDHPHILPLHDFGEQQLGENEILTYSITPHIGGGSLRARLEQANGPLPPDEAMHYLRQAAGAIDFAHSRQVMHLDIKPGKMLLQQGTLYLTDFGLANLLTGINRRDQTYSGAGTPEYTAPEQAQGRSEFASDRYSFAVVAYEMFSGRVPFKGQRSYDTLLKHISAKPPSPRQFNPHLPQNVEQLLLQALAKDPSKRAPSCQEMVSALDKAWQWQRAVETPARPVEVVPVPIDPDKTMLAPWSRKLEENELSIQAPGQQPAPPASTYYNEQVAPASMPNPMYTPYGPSAQEVSTKAKTENPKPRVSRRTLLIGGAIGGLALLGAGSALFAYSRLNPGTPASQSETPTPQKPAPGPQKIGAGVPVLSLRAHKDEVSIVLWEASGRYLLTGGKDAVVMLWDMSEALKKAAGTQGVQPLSAPLRRWNLPSAIFPNKLCLSGDGNSFAVSTGANGTLGNTQVYVFDTSKQGNTPVAIYPAQADSASALTYSAIDWSPTGPRFAISRFSDGQQEQMIEIWQVGNTNQAVQTLTAPAGASVRTNLIDYAHILNAFANVNALGWSADGMKIASHTNSGQVTIWEAETGKVLQTLELPVHEVKKTPGIPTSPLIQGETVFSESVAWSPTNNNLLAATNLDQITLWDTEKMQLLRVVKTEDTYPFLTGLTWSPNGRFLAGSYARRIHILDTQSAGQSTTQNPEAATLSFPKNVSNGHSAAIFDVSWSPDGQYIASASGDGSVLVWKVGENG